MILAKCWTAMSTLARAVATVAVLSLLQSLALPWIPVATGVRSQRLGQVFLSPDRNVFL